MKPAHHRSGGYRNSDPDIVIGNFPWYEMVWRGLRGDFKPLSEPSRRLRGLCARRGACRWITPASRLRQVEPVVTWLGHVTVLLQVGGLNILTDPDAGRLCRPLRPLWRAANGSARR